MYKAHISENGEVQSVKQHCENTAELAASFSVPEMCELNRAIGLMHDIGKYQASFQKRINGESVKVEHSICGAQAAKEMFAPPVAHLIASCIAGHHGGLPDPGSTGDDADMPTLRGRLSRQCEDFGVYKSELNAPQIDESRFMRFLAEDCGKNVNLFIDKYAFLTRYCFSCLTDADSVDTAEFCTGAKRKLLKTDFAGCLELVNKRLNSFSCVTRLQKARSKLQQQAYDKSDINADIYLMNMPTGSGKTLCSIKLALEKALKTGKKRIIYIIPYNSIIDQTANEFESVFGKNCGLLRHQSTFSYDDCDKYDKNYKLAASLSAENWDAQLIITTAVQFFESVYSNRRGKLRKLHNMANSILVFDEAHLMPVNYLQPCLEAVAFITRYLNSQAVFLTATMPDFKKLINDAVMPQTRVAELITDKTLFSEFEKCSYEYSGCVCDEELLAAASKYPSSLIIVNKRANAKKLFAECAGKKYHLSTYMTAVDRMRVIDDIRAELQSLYNDYPDCTDIPEERRITVISTSLIEAGVDVDFFCVFRELSGLDSILQAGGRCNREGKRKNAKVFVFELESEKGKPSKDMRVNITKGIVGTFENIACSESIKEYYDKLFYINNDAISENAIHNYCASYNTIPFRSYADKFELIESKTVSVVYAQDEAGQALVEKLKSGEPLDARKLQKYAFTVYGYELDDLLKQHVVSDFGRGVWCLTNPDYYDADTGVLFQAKDKYV